MKKLILIFGAFSIIFVIISSVIQPNVASADTADNILFTQDVDNEQIFTVKSENGRIVVYEGDTLYLKTSTATNTLPKKDQKTLLYGINVSSKQEMEKILQQYCS